VVKRQRLDYSSWNSWRTEVSEPESTQKKTDEENLAEQIEAQAKNYDELATSTEEHARTLSAGKGSESYQLRKIAADLKKMYSTALTLETSVEDLDRFTAKLAEEPELAAAAAAQGRYATAMKEYVNTVKKADRIGTALFDLAKQLVELEHEAAISATEGAGAAIVVADALRRINRTRARKSGPNR
jgi:hypothetical protein